MRMLLPVLLCLVGLAGCGGGVDGSSSGGSSGDTDAGVTDGGGSSSSSSGGACTTDTWANYAGSFFANTCDSCHQHTSEFSSLAAVTAKKSTVTSRISTGNMPTTSTLAASEKSRILAWLACSPLP